MTKNELLEYKFFCRAQGMTLGGPPRRADIPFYRSWSMDSRGNMLNKKHTSDFEYAELYYEMT